MVVLSVSHETKTQTQEWWGWFIFIETSVDEEVDVKGDRLIVGEEGAVAADLRELLQVPAEVDHVAVWQLASKIKQMPDGCNLSMLDVFVVDLNSMPNEADEGVPWDVEHDVTTLTS